MREPLPGALPRRRAAAPLASHLLLAAAIVGFACAAYGPALSVPFIGDDYIFLDKTRATNFLSLWAPGNTDFGWYRPWSREVHFWALQHLFGAHPLGFRLASLCLWLAGMGLYFTNVRSLSTARTAGFATLGVASLALWGAPLVWISGSQDLWMIVFAMATLALHLRGPAWGALLAFAGALLSKETAAVLPLILLAYEGVVRRSPARVLARRLLPFFALGGVWLFAHPVLLRRLLAGNTHYPGAEAHPASATVLLQTVLSTVNLDRVFAPVDPLAFRPGWMLLSTAALGLGVFAASRLPTWGRSRPDPGPGRGRLVQFGLLWAGIGWLPLFTSSIGWHAYYGCLGSFGLWLAIAAGLEGSGPAPAAIILALGLLRGRAAATRSWDWGSEWYQRRAGNLLELIRDQLRLAHPRLPHHTRVYFGHVPNNIGLIAGQSPAIRVWYGDSTLEAGFYSYYRPRAAGAPGGSDLFFHFDTTSGLREVHLGPESLAAAMRDDPGWEKDHESVAALLVANGDPARAALEYEKLAALQWRPDALVFASVCWRVAGDAGRADSLLDLARARLGASRAQIGEFSERLLRTLPHG